MKTKRELSLDELERANGGGAAYQESLDQERLKGGYAMQADYNFEQGELGLADQVAMTAEWDGGFEYAVVDHGLNMTADLDGGFEYAVSPDEVDVTADLEGGFDFGVAAQEINVTADLEGGVDFGVAADDINMTTELNEDFDYADVVVAEGAARRR